MTTPEQTNKTLAAYNLPAGTPIPPNTLTDIDIPCCPPKTQTTTTAQTT
jgi:hypothetical protein